MPARLASGLHGSHIQPPDHAVVPPNTSSFSHRMTDKPSVAEVTAVERPPAPDPSTRTSHCSALMMSALAFLRAHPHDRLPAMPPAPRHAGQPDTQKQAPARA